MVRVGVRVRVRVRVRNRFRVAIHTSSGSVGAAPLMSSTSGCNRPGCNR